MAQNLCPINQPCIDDLTSLGNFSSEAPDVPLFKSILYRKGPTSADCLAVCASEISQEEADLCAARAQALCNVTFKNVIQTCKASCAKVGYTTPAGAFVAATQSEADALAAANTEAQLTRICDGLWPTPPEKWYVNTPQTFLKYTDQYTPVEERCLNNKNWKDTTSAGRFKATSQADADSAAMSAAQSNVETWCATDPVGSEVIDVDGRYYLYFPHDDPPLWYLSAAVKNTRDCTPTYTVPAGSFTATSQAQADALALNYACMMANAFCEPEAPLPPNAPIPPKTDPPVLPPTIPPQPPTPVPNTPQSCSVPCPGGECVYTRLIAAGVVYENGQAAADAAAQSLACKQAQANTQCLGSLSPGCCIDVELSQSITITNPGSAPLSLTLTGILPSGVSAVFNGNVIVISGVPIEAGTFNFTLKLTDSLGNYSTRSYVLRVMQINPASILQPGTINQSYLQTLSCTANSYVAPLSFQLAPGSSLPPGLTLNESTGAISGIPTVAGDYTFTVVVQDAAT